MNMTDAEILSAALDGTLKQDDEHTEQPDEPEQASVETPDPEAKADEPETEVEGAPILSKSGGYTIPYQKLADARTERDTLREQNAQLQSQLAELTARQQQNLAAIQADAQDRANTGQAQTQADANVAAATQAIATGAVDISVFGDFSEEALAKGVAELNRRAMEQVRNELHETIRKELEPLRVKEAKSAQELHVAAILNAHPDAFEIVEAAEFDAWRNTLPAFARAGVDNALTNGDAKTVIEVFDAFRSTQGTPPAVPRKAQAQEAPRARVPTSLSEVPGAAPIDETQQTLAMAGNSAALMDRMGAMTPEQVDALLDRI